MNDRLGVFLKHDVKFLTKCMLDQLCVLGFST